MAERMVETQAELPFIGDQVVCLSHDQAAPTIWLPKDRRVRSLSSGKAQERPMCVIGLTPPQPTFEVAHISDASG